MPKFVIERDVPGAEKSNRSTTAGKSPKSLSTFLKGMGPRDSMASQLRDWRQSLLRLSRSRRGYDPGTRQARGDFLPTVSPLCADSSTRQMQSKWLQKH